MNDIRTHPRATQQSRVKCRRHINIPAVPTQEAIPEEGGYLKNTKKRNLTFSISVKFVKKKIFCLESILVYPAQTKTGTKISVFSDSLFFVCRQSQFQCNKLSLTPGQKKRLLVTSLPPPKFCQFRKLASFQQKIGLSQD